MIGKQEIIEKAYECGFADAGFTTAEPFSTQRSLLQERQEEYGWAIRSGLDLLAGTDPQTILPGAKSIIVVIEAYFREAFPGCRANAHASFLDRGHKRQARRLCLQKPSSKALMRAHSQAILTTFE